MVGEIQNLMKAGKVLHYGLFEPGVETVQGDIRGIETRFSPENIQINLAIVELLKK